MNEEPERSTSAPTTASPWLTLIGLGADGAAGLTEAVRALIADAEWVVGGARHLQLVESLITGQSLAWSSPLTSTLPELLALRGRRVVVLASGDPFFYGVGTLLRRHLSAAEIHCIPHPSSVALAAARLGWTQQACATVSLAGRPLTSLRPALHPGRGLFVLSADAKTPGEVAQALIEWGFGASEITILERLGGPDEAMKRYSAAALANAAPAPDFAPLNLMAIAVEAERSARILASAPGLPDDWFEHDGQITKREVRAVTLSSLRPQHGQVLWDIGCGSGSIAIEWLLAHPSTQAVAFERDPERAARAQRNAVELGVPRLVVRTGSAPQCLDDFLDHFLADSASAASSAPSASSASSNSSTVWSTGSAAFTASTAATGLSNTPTDLSIESPVGGPVGWPLPDAIFLGGGLRDLTLIEKSWELLPVGGRLVANAVVLETEQLLFAAWQRYGGQLTRFGCERLDRVGTLHAFRPTMRVLQWVAEKNSGLPTVPGPSAGGKRKA